MVLMSRFDRLPSQLQAALAEHRLLKVIAGLTNFDAGSVERISHAAGLGGADLIDLACDPELVAMAAPFAMPLLPMVIMSWVSSTTTCPQAPR